MNSKLETLAMLAQLPDDSPAWDELRENVLLLRGLARAEADVREGRTMSLGEARKRMEQKWQRPVTPSN